MMDQASLAARLAAAQGWEAKNRLLVQLAREIPGLREQDKTEANRIQGCESQVWVLMSWHEDRLQLATDSDSRIVKGLLALVQTTFHDQTRDEILQADFEGWLNALGLARFLSASRGNGLKSIVKHIKAAAEAHANPSA